MDIVNYLIFHLNRLQLPYTIQILIVLDESIIVHNSLSNTRRLCTKQIQSCRIKKVNDFKNIDIPKALEEIGDAVMSALVYKPYPINKINLIIKILEGN